MKEMDIEFWKEIEGYEGLYQVSNWGRIRNSYGMMLKQRYQNSGYLTVHLYNSKKRKAFTTHRLVAIAYVQNESNNEFVNHKDGIKTNNHADNLEWCTCSENMQHAVKTGLHVPYERTDEQRKITGERMIKMHRGVSKSVEHCLRMSIDRKGKAPKCITERNRKDFIKVLCVETGNVFPTMRDAGESIGLSKDKMRRHLYYGTHYPEITLTYKIVSNAI